MEYVWLASTVSLDCFRFYFWSCLVRCFVSGHAVTSFLPLLFLACLTPQSCCGYIQSDVLRASANRHWRSDLIVDAPKHFSLAITRESLRGYELIR